MDLICQDSAECVTVHMLDMLYGFDICVVEINVMLNMLKPAYCGQCWEMIELHVVRISRKYPIYM